MIDRRKLKAQLALKGWRVLDLANVLGVPKSTLYSWLTGVVAAPADLEERVTAALGVPLFSLRADRAGRPA
jgi:hypothetical protein